MPLSTQGFTPKSFNEIRSDISDNLKLALGSDIDTSATSRIGQFIDIVSTEIYSTWQALQDVYNSWFPDTSTGTSLDNVSSITNTFRLAATSATAKVYYAGQSGTVIPLNHQIQKTASGDIFLAQSQYTISDQANAIIAANVATNGTITLAWDTEAIAAINWDDTASEIKSKIEAHSKITTVNITGSFDSVGAIHIDLVAHTLSSTQVSVNANTLSRNSEALTVNGYFASKSDNPVIAQATGAINVPSLSIKTIVTPITGLSAVINFDDGIAGTNRETDAELRARRNLELQRAGTATAGGIVEQISSLAVVNRAAIVENDSDAYIPGAISPNEMPPHSFEIFVNALDTTENNNQIAQAIYDSKPVGIEVVSTDNGGRTGLYEDVNGNTGLIMPFSSIVDVPIYVTVTRTIITSVYPSDGDEQIKANIIAFFSTLELGEDVYIHRLYSPVNLVEGISDLEIVAGISAGSQTSANISIDPYQLATIEEANITIA